MKRIGDILIYRDDEAKVAQRVNEIIRRQCEDQDSRPVSPEHNHKHDLYRKHQINFV